MMDDEVDGPTEAEILPDEDGLQLHSGGEVWCDDELALDQPREAVVEDETIVIEENCEVTSPADPDLWLYRDRTIAILRRYLRLAVEVGRLPALLGREFFRTRVTSYHTQTFEDTVIFAEQRRARIDRRDRDATASSLRSGADVAMHAAYHSAELWGGIGQIK
jgi:hypothetical protein